MERNEHRRRWAVRISRASELLEQHTAVVPALRLYRATLEFQQNLALQSNQIFDPQVPLREQIDLSEVSAAIPAILSLGLARGTETLKRAAQDVRQSGESAWRCILNAALTGNSSLTATEDFFVRACLQPVAENLQLQLSRDANYYGSACPACGGLPQVAVLRPEGEGSSRWLQCSFCWCEWPFRRLVCAWCGEEDKEKLPRYSNEEWPYVHVEACDTCKHYLKAIDMSIDGFAVPIVDEAALAVLDVWANDCGYTKITRNLLGF